VTRLTILKAEVEVNDVQAAVFISQTVSMSHAVILTLTHLG